jgi:hypothetical protein
MIRKRERAAEAEIHSITSSRAMPIKHQARKETLLKRIEMRMR